VENNQQAKLDMTSLKCRLAYLERELANLRKSTARHAKYIDEGLAGLEFEILGLRDNLSIPRIRHNAPHL